MTIDGVLGFEDLLDAHCIAFCAAKERRQQRRNRRQLKGLRRAGGVLARPQHTAHGVAQELERAADLAQPPALLGERPDWNCPDLVDT
jgi:hypothetical protein